MNVTTRDGSVLGDSTATELKVLPATVPTVLTNPTAGLANTGMPVWVVEAMSGVMMGMSSVLVGWLRKKNI